MDLQGSSGGSLQGGGVNLQGPGAPSYVRPNGAFWQGADGNVYVAGAAGTHSAGAFDSNTANYWGSRGYTQQADPNAPKVASNGTGSGGSNLAASNITSAAAKGPVAEDKSADILVQKAGIGAADQQRDAGIASVNNSYNNIIGGYNRETATNEGQYNNESNSNQTNLQDGKQTSLVHAAQGRHGLFATLSSIGALSDDSIAEANHAVQDGANTDLKGATNTFANNQSSLDGAIHKYRDEDTTRRTDALTQANNLKTNETNKALQAKQGFYSALEGDYTKQLDVGQAHNYAQMAADLYPQIAATNVPTGQLAPTGAAYTAPTLASYLGNDNTTVRTTPQGGAPGDLPGLSAINSLSGKKNTGSGVVAI
jgi:hypothetical protein